MRYTVDDQGEEFYPRLINWHLVPPSHDSGAGDDPLPAAGEEARQEFSLHECLLTIDSIARLAKPIVVLAGGRALQRSDLFEVVEYGTALGLKMIVEDRPETITYELARKFSVFGPRVFRVLLDDCIDEDPVTRYKASPQFIALGTTLRLLQKTGYEIHLGVTTRNPVIRQLAYEHDYAFRLAAKGLYCHLDFDSSDVFEEDEEAESHSLNDFIDAIA